jgi:hypothetical protein
MRNTFHNSFTPISKVHDHFHLRDDISHLSFAGDFESIQYIFPTKSVSDKFGEVIAAFDFSVNREFPCPWINGQKRRLSAEFSL